MANANAIAFLAWLQNPTGVGNSESAQAIVNQGIETLDNLNLLDNDDIDIICEGARKPGGFIANLNDATLMIPNPGRPIPALFQMKLKLFAMATQHYLTVSRSMTAALLSWEQTSHFWDLRRLNENWTESGALPPLSRSIPIMKMLELMRSQLRKMLGVWNIPLAYVVQCSATVEPITSATLRPVPSTLPYAAQYSTFHKDLIQRASHDHPSFDENSALVLDVVEKILKESTHMMNIKLFQARHDSRAAFLAVESHNYGPGK